MFSSIEVASSSIPGGGGDVLIAMWPFGQRHRALALRGVTTFLAAACPVLQRLLFVVHLSIVAQTRWPLPPAWPDFTSTWPNRRAGPAVRGCRYGSGR